MNEIDIIVPVLGRPHRAKPFTNSLHNSVDQDQVRLTVVTEPEGEDQETKSAWEAVISSNSDQILSIPEAPGTFARKINYGYHNTSAPWLLLVGDDVAFHRGWLSAAIDVAERTEADVIGTNDKGYNRQGTISPHIVIYRDYVDRFGASWDGPGVVCHEGYYHTCVDHEIALVAHDRYAWAYADQSIIEHYHFAHKKDVPKDETYHKGMVNARKDRDLLSRRSVKYIGSVAQ